MTSISHHASVNSILTSIKSGSSDAVAVNQQYAAELGSAYNQGAINTQNLISKIGVIKGLQTQAAGLQASIAKIQAQLQFIAAVPNPVYQMYQMVGAAYNPPPINAGGGAAGLSSSKATLSAHLSTINASIASTAAAAEAEFDNAAYGVTNQAGVNRQVVDGHNGATSTERIRNYHNDIITPIANLINTLTNTASISSSNSNINLQPANTQAGLNNLRSQGLSVVANQLNGATQQDISNHRGVNVKEKISNYYDDIVNPIKAQLQRFTPLNLPIPSQFNPPTYTQAGLNDVNQYINQALFQPVVDALDAAGGAVGFVSSIQQGVNLSAQDLVTVSQNLVSHVKSTYAGVTDQSLLGTSNFDYSSDPLLAAQTVQQKVSDFYTNLVNPINVQIQRLTTLNEAVPPSLMDGGTPPKILSTQANLAALTQYANSKETIHNRIDGLIEAVKNEFTASNVQYNQNTITMLEKAKEITDEARSLRAKGWKIKNLQPTNAVLASLRTATQTQNSLDTMVASNDAADAILSGMKTALEDQSYTIKAILGVKRKEIEALRKELDEARIHMATLNSIMPVENDKDTKVSMPTPVKDFMSGRSLPIASSGNQMTQTQVRSNIETTRGYVEKKNNEVQMLMQEVQHFTNLQLQGPDLLASIIQETYQQRSGITGAM